MDIPTKPTAFIDADIAVWPQCEESHSLADAACPGAWNHRRHARQQPLLRQARSHLTENFPARFPMQLDDPSKSNVSPTYENFSRNSFPSPTYAKTGGVSSLWKVSARRHFRSFACFPALFRSPAFPRSLSGHGSRVTKVTGYTRPPQKAAATKTLSLLAARHSPRLS